MLVDEGGDWDRRNRLKVYEGLYKMSIRDFERAGKLFLDTVSTFTSYDIMDYEQFIFYTVICCLLTMPRVDLSKKVSFVDFCMAFYCIVLSCIALYCIVLYCVRI